VQLFPEVCRKLQCCCCCRSFCCSYGWRAT